VHAIVLDVALIFDTGGLPLFSVLLDGGFGHLVVFIRAVEANSLNSSGLVDVGADDIPALAKVQDSLMPLRRPALRGDPNSF
jgi:hypothetical protein